MASADPPHYSLSTKRVAVNKQKANWVPYRHVKALEGEMAEWLKAHAWKACTLQKGVEGSNPSLSAK
jgi:hypothetical protein